MFSLKTSNYFSFLLLIMNNWVPLSYCIYYIGLESFTDFGLGIPPYLVLLGVIDYM